MLIFLPDAEPITPLSGLDTIRKQSRELFVHFLAHYPMATKRLQQHLEFVLTHLGYEYEAGRLSALQLVHQVVADFPEELVLEHAQFVMMPLVLRLVNDESNKVMVAAAKTLQALVKRLDKGALDTVIDFCLRWFEQKKPGLVRAAAQVPVAYPNPNPNPVSYTHLTLPTICSV